MTDKKRDITEVSLEEICELAAQAGQEAARESLETGLEILSEEIATGRFVFERLDENGQIIKRYVTKEELDKEIDEHDLS
ncbi:hypothetical protein [Sessilibacter sp. MAH4]